MDYAAKTADSQDRENFSFEVMAVNFGKKQKNIQSVLRITLWDGKTYLNQM